VQDEDHNLFCKIKRAALTLLQHSTKRVYMNIYDNLYFSCFMPLSGAGSTTAGTTWQQVVRLKLQAFYSHGKKEKVAGPDGMSERKVFACITNRIQILQCCSLQPSPFID
jgi:hypothetical protein